MVLLEKYKAQPVALCCWLRNKQLAERSNYLWPQVHQGLMDTELWESDRLTFFVAEHKAQPVALWVVGINRSLMLISLLLPKWSP